MSSIIFKRGTPLIWHIKVYRYCGVPLHKAFCESWWSRAKQAKHTKTSDWTADCRVALWVIQTPGSDKKEKCMKLCTVQSFFCFDTLILTVATLWDLSNHLLGAASSQLNQIDKNITQVLTCTFSSCAVHWGWVHTLFFFLSFSHNSSRKHSTDPFMERYACLAEDRSVYSLQTRFMIKRLLRVRAAVWSFELQPER